MNKLNLIPDFRLLLLLMVMVLLIVTLEIFGSMTVLTGLMLDLLEDLKDFRELKVYKV